MKERWVDVTQNFTASRDTVFEYIAEHENLAPMFQAKVTRIKDGDTERNGVGSVRLVKLGPTPAVEETQTKFERPGLIEYRVTRGPVIRNHIGIITFTELPGGGCSLNWRIRISSPYPGAGLLLSKGLSAGLTKSLGKLSTTLK